MRQEMIETITDAARAVFARFGFKKTTMDDIAQAAHKGKSSIYHYFESKAAVFQSVVEKESRTLRETLGKAIQREITPQMKLQAYVITRMEVMDRLSSFYSALKDEYLENYGFIEKTREKYLREEIDIVKGILTEGIKDGIFVVEDLEVTTMAIIAALKSFEYPWPTTDGVSKIKKNIDVLLNVLFRGITTR